MSSWPSKAQPSGSTFGASCLALGLRYDRLFRGARYLPFVQAP
jgi:hypothetical protein